MKIPANATAAIISVLFVFSIIAPSSYALGSGTTLAVTDASSATVCGIVAASQTRRIQCYRRGSGGAIIPVFPDVSFSSISGGRSYFCALRSGNYSLLCWNTTTTTNAATFESKRLYNNDTVLFENLAVGDSQVCATVVGTGTASCWRTGRRKGSDFSSGSDRFASISSGSGFSCGILKESSRIRCWGSNASVADSIESEFRNVSMLSIVAGGSHLCGLNSTGFLVCKGSNSFGQIEVPHQGVAFEYSGLALGDSHSCAIRRSNGSVFCWGGNGIFNDNFTKGVSFEVIVSGSDFICGLTTRNFSVLCWGPGWSNGSDSDSDVVVPFLSPILPGPCVQSSCSECGIYPQSQYLCSGFGNICKPKPCGAQVPVMPARPPAVVPLPAAAPSSRSKTLTTGLLAFAIVGSVGAIAGVCTLLYCLWNGVCLGKKKIHNSVQPTITRGGSSNNGRAVQSNSPLSRSMTVRRQGSRIMRRQRSGTSSAKHPDKPEEFTLADLSAATNNFSPENKIGAGSFGIVYRGKLADGREVAIKRGETESETGNKMKKFQEKESAFESELASLSRLHHKHLVRLVGFCEEKDEKLLVYEYMKNGALYDHLHGKNNVDKNSSVLNSWRMRIKIALDASRGIEYLHNYAVPSIIHRDIKSSNILIDATWTARVSDFGLSLMSPEPDTDFRPTKAAGTVGYIDPESYGLNVLTTKSDVYGLGVVLLELLTGKRAIFKIDETSGTPVSLVDFAVPAIKVGELAKILDPRVAPPELNEMEALELVAYTAMHCVNLEGKDRPTMADIVANLERALSLCESSSHGSISSGTISVVSD
ncbi:putative serine/threonine-protein kinase-like protein CCR3 [Arachis duranensis]|uniref:non-specific serine/threonine protein kinase n=1 Tax=Arachis duranensis TaxID=130453 RepID=A0A6P4B2Y2_ARADU|nr:putative serine/threonine-protein kinase-like protein CCR3 [Arachis duranensis]